MRRQSAEQARRVPSGTRARRPARAAPEVAPVHDAVLDLQRTAGNRAVTDRLTATGPRAVAREPEGDGPAPDPDAAPKRTGTFAKKQFSLKGASRDFESTYDVVGPTPATGTLTITLNVFVKFKNFDKTMRNREPWKSHTFTADQLADFKWTDKERTAFKTDFASAVHDGWSDKFQMVLDDESLAEHRADVDVQVKFVDSAGKANNVMTAQKVPKGAPRLRSSAGTATSTIDIRDPTEPETFTVRDKQFIRQVQGFKNDSAEITSKMQSRIDDVADDLKALAPTFGKQKDPDGTARDWNLVFQGRATKVGSDEHNDQLGEDRALAVQKAVNEKVGWGDQGGILSQGEKNTTNDPKFRRVDVFITDLAGTHEVPHNTAAHEAGHMFGLDDEYEEEDADKDANKKFLGDEPSHYGDVDAELGSEAANELVDADNGSIMSAGNEVKKGHYVYFLQALNTMTKKEWTVE
jgi:outer membrane protein OmpA-like peptidoglycan-associated protein